MPKHFENSDELIKQMELDELSDATKLTPRDYGKLRGHAPQLIYYYIRTGKLDVEKCLCGRKVIDVADADAFFESRKKKGSGVSVEPDSD